MAWIAKDVGVSVAKMASASGVLRVAAEKICAKAEGIAASHLRTGAYASHFGVAPTPGKSGVIDYIAYNDDPAAMSIEFGHTTPSGTHVAGLHALGAAAWR